MFLTIDLNNIWFPSYSHHWNQLTVYQFMGLHSIPVDQPCDNNTPTRAYTGKGRRAGQSSRKRKWVHFPSFRFFTTWWRQWQCVWGRGLHLQRVPCKDIRPSPGWKLLQRSGHLHRYDMSLHIRTCISVHVNYDFSKCGNLVWIYFYSGMVCVTIRMQLLWNGYVFCKYIKFFVYVRCLFFFSMSSAREDPLLARKKEIPINQA